MDKKVWEIITDYIAETFPELDVRRVYDAAIDLAEIESAQKPILAVILGDKSIEKVTRAQVQETYGFMLILMKYLAAQEEAEKMAQADEMLPWCNRFFDAFTQKTLEKDGIQLKLMVADRPGNEMFDLEMYTDEIFQIIMTLDVVRFREM